MSANRRPVAPVITLVAGAWAVLIILLVTPVAGATDLYWVQYRYEGGDRASLHRASVNDRRARRSREVIHDMGELPAYASLVIDGDKIYWADAWSGGDTGILQRANLDGTVIETLVGSSLYMDDYPVDLALDVPQGKMYWVNMANGKIQRARLDGSRVEDVVTGILPFSIALDIGGRSR